MEDESLPTCSLKPTYGSAELGSKSGLGAMARARKATRHFELTSAYHQQRREIRHSGRPLGHVRTNRLAAIRCYSINSSARTISDDGMVKPSVLAVLMLITSSNFIGRSIGRSRGLLPFKILST